MGGSNRASRYAKTATQYAMKNNVLAEEYREELKPQAAWLDQYGQDTLDKFETMFGGVEKNVAEYYTNLDPAKFAKQNKTSLNEHLQQQMDTYTDSMASRGLMSSGMRAQAEKEAKYAQATGNANIDMQAPDQVAQMQSGYMQQGNQMEQRGLNQKQGALDILNLGYNVETGANTNTANAFSNAAQIMGQPGQGGNEWSRATNMLVDAGATGAGLYASGGLSAAVPAAKATGPVAG